MQHICTPLDVNLIFSVCFLWIICPKKRTVKKHEIDIKWWWAGPDVPEQEKEETEILSSLNTQEKAAAGRILWICDHFCTYFMMLVGQFKLLLAQLSPQKDRLIISESSLSWNSVWGKTVLFCYFHIILYLILVHVWSCECTSCQMQWSDKSYMFVNIQKIGEKKNKTLHKFYTPGVQRPLDLN